MSWAATAQKPLRSSQVTSTLRSVFQLGKMGLAAVCVVDEVREDALRAINSLKQANIKTAMLTGDRAEIANDTAKSLGITMCTLDFCLKTS